MRPLLADLIALVSLLLLLPRGLCADAVVPNATANSTTQTATETSTTTNSSTTTSTMTSTMTSTTVTNTTTGTSTTTTTTPTVHFFLTLSNIEFHNLTDSHKDQRDLKGWGS